MTSVVVSFCPHLRSEKSQVSVVFLGVLALDIDLHSLDADENESFGNQESQVTTVALLELVEFKHVEMFETTDCDFLVYKVNQEEDDVEY